MHSITMSAGDIMEYIEIEELLDEDGELSNMIVEIMPTLDEGILQKVRNRYYPKN